MKVDNDLKLFPILLSSFIFCSHLSAPRSQREPLFSIDLNIQARGAETFKQLRR